jgi:glycosyltransferase involved in cell wall biosynthesis
VSVANGRRLLMIEQGGRGGVTDYTGELVAALAAEGWTVTLATAADHGYPPLPGVRIVPVFHYVRGDTALGRAVRARGLGRIANGLRFLAALPRLVWLAARADVIHTQGWETPQIGVPAVIALRLAGRPVVQTSHGMFDRATTSRGARRLARRLVARLTARTIVHTQADLASLPAALAARTVVIPHGEYGGLARTGGPVDRDAARAELGLDADVPATLMFGQLRPDKGLDDLVAAVAAVPGLHLLIGGEDLGGLAAVRDALKDLDERATVREGFLEMSEVATLFAAADTVALPYREASQSGVLLLAYGFARPVVVYPAGGMVEAVIDGETGWVCAAPSVAALSAALSDTVRAGAAECARRGERGEALAAECFAWPAIARRTAAVYAELIGA